MLQVEGVEVNAEDMKGEATALQYAALAGNEPCVDLLLSYGASCSSEIQDIIRDKIPHFDPVKFTTARTGRPLKNILFNLIELGDNVDSLDSYVGTRTNVDWNADNGQYTLLQYACDMGRDGVAGYLLDHGARYDVCATNSQPAPVIAASHGYHKVKQILPE